MGRREAHIDRLAEILGEPHAFLARLPTDEANAVFAQTLQSAHARTTRDDRPAAELAVLALIRRGHDRLRRIDADIRRAQVERRALAELLREE